MSQFAAGATWKREAKDAWQARSAESQNWNGLPSLICMPGRLHQAEAQTEGLDLRTKVI